MTDPVKKGQRRAGAAIVELAICLPLLFLLVIGTIEVNNSIFLKQTLTSAVHDGALTGLRMNATEQEIKDRVETILNARGVSDFELSLETESGTAFSQLSKGEAFTVVVGASTGEYSGMIDWNTVEASATALKQ